MIGVHVEVRIGVGVGAVVPRSGPSFIRLWSGAAIRIRVDIGIPSSSPVLCSAPNYSS